MPTPKKPHPGRDAKSEPPSLERFIDELKEIVPRPGRPVRPQSHLVHDLGFDAAVLDRLASLLYERYGVVGLSPTLLSDGKHLTVEAFFWRYVVEVLGVRPQRPGGR